MRIVDAHHHLWDPTAIDYRLLTGQGRLASLARPFRAVDFDAVARENGIAEGIVVEAASAGADIEAETQWLLHEVASSSVTRRIVAYAAIELPGIGAWLDHLIQVSGSRVVGVRRSFETVPAGFALRPEVVAGIRAVAARGLTFDLVLFGDRLGEVVELVESVPEARFVLDHLGKPALERKVQVDWKHNMAALARLPNVVAKVSGLITETADGRWDDSLVRPYVRHAADTFGWDRLLFASDWPVCKLAGGYRRWLDFCLDTVGTEGDAAARRFLSETADETYTIPPSD